MTISSTNRKAGPFVGNGTATVFPFYFKVFTAADVEVVRLNVSTTVETVLVLTSDYTVSLNTDQNANPGGSITLVAGALASGFNLVVTSDIGNLQPTDLTNQGGFYPDVINDALDRATIQIQQLQESVDRAALLPITSAEDAASLVADIVRLADSADNLDTDAVNIASINTVAGAITNVNTVATNINNVNTVAGVSGNVTTVAGSIANVNTVAADLNEPTSEINTVAVNITNVNSVGDNIANVNAVGSDLLEPVSEINTVAVDIANVNSVATNITAVNSAYTNLAAILDAPTQASNAANSAAQAAASASAASTSASNASTSASNASTSASTATTQATNASASATSAAASYDSFDDRYLGAKASDPTLDNDGNALLTGALYFNTVSNEMRVYTGAAWVAAYVSSTAYVGKTSSTGSAVLPASTTGNRDGSPAAGYLRFNTTNTTFEGYNGTAWGSVGGGATGGGNDQVFQENQLIVTTNYTLSTGKSAISKGPITINSGVVVTIPSGYSWAIL